MDKCNYGRASGTKSWFGARRSRRTEEASSKHERANLDQESHDQHFAVGIYHYLWDLVGVQNDYGGWPDDGSRHNDDVHVLRVFRHV